MEIHLIFGLAMTGCGLFFFLLGLFFHVFQYRRQKRMTARTEGQVSRYSFLGKNNIAPVISYVVGGKPYEVRRKFRSIVVKSTRAPIPTVRDSGAYVNKKDVLVLHTGNMNNYEAMMEALWPLGQSVPVFYNPEKPEQACAEKFLQLPPVVSIVYMCLGARIALSGILGAVLLS